MPKGLRARSYWTRLLRVVASFVALARPLCTCSVSGRDAAFAFSHAATCPRFLHVRLLALLERSGLEPYSDGYLATVLEELEAGGTQGGADAVWKGGGMDEIVALWFSREIDRAKRRAARARAHGEATTAHDSRVKALKDARTAIRRYAENGTQIHPPPPKEQNR